MEVIQMSAAWFKRTNVADACKTVEGILTEEFVSEVKIEKLGSGDIIKLKAYACEDDCRKLNELLYNQGWANDLETLSKK
jgi:hypothetical protein